MDLATIIGVVGGLGVVVLAMMMKKGNPADMLKNPAALVLTIGGAIAASMTSYPLKTLLCRWSPPPRAVRRPRTSIPL